MVKSVSMVMSNKILSRGTQLAKTDGEKRNKIRITLLTIYLFNCLLLVRNLF